MEYEKQLLVGMARQLLVYLAAVGSSCGCNTLCEIICILKRTSIILNTVYIYICFVLSNNHSVIGPTTLHCLTLHDLLQSYYIIYMNVILLCYQLHTVLIILEWTTSLDTSSRTLFVSPRLRRTSSYVITSDCY